MTEDSRQADVFEITREMIEAGADAIASNDPEIVGPENSCLAVLSTALQAGRIPYKFCDLSFLGLNCFHLGK